MGRQFLTEAVSPPLWINVTVACFQLEGTLELTRLNDCESLDDSGPVAEYLLKSNPLHLTYNSANEGDKVLIEWQTQGLV